MDATQESPASKPTQDVTIYAFRVGSKALLTKLGYTGNLDEKRVKGKPFKSPQLTFRAQVDDRMFAVLKAKDAISEIHVAKEEPIATVIGMQGKAGGKIRSPLDQPEAKRLGKRPASLTQ